MAMETGICFSIIYSDGDLLELQIEASNGVFSGRAQVYAHLDTPRELATKLDGFPIEPADVRILEAGTIKSEYPGGVATLRFYCTDSAGHSAVEVRLRGGALTEGPSEATFHIRVEPAAIDLFLGELTQMGALVGDTAFLRAQLPPY